MMNFREKKLYHQIHPVKLATDIGVTPIFLCFIWRHRIAPAVVAGFFPPVIVSAAMMIWPPDLERLKNSALGNYMFKYMTRIIEAVRLLTLAPMAWGAWTHNWRPILLGLLILLLAWCNGLILPRSRSQRYFTGGEVPTQSSARTPTFGLLGKNACEHAANGQDDG